MSEPLILEASPKVATLEDYFLDYCQNKEVEPDRLGEMVEAGWLFPETFALTDAGLDKAEAMQIPMKRVTVLTLGREISAYTAKGAKKKVVEGSTLLVLFKQRDKKGTQYYTVSAGDEFPILTIYQNSHDKVEEHRWPMLLPVMGKYIDP